MYKGVPTNQRMSTRRVDVTFHLDFREPETSSESKLFPKMAPQNKHVIFDVVGKLKRKIN